MHPLKKDRFKSARGGHSRLLDISCAACRTYVCRYQKDGPGVLKRMYLDRILGPHSPSADLSCSGCGKALGSRMIYEKEQRPAYRLFSGSVTKKIVKSPGA